MQVVANFNPTINLTGTFTAPAQPGSHLLIINESYANLTVTFPNGATSYVPANDRRLYCLNGSMAQPHPVYTWTAQSYLTNANSINQVVAELYDPGENTPEKYPSPLIRQTNLGSGLQNVIASSLVNDDNAAGFQIVESQVSGDGVGSAVVLTNDGNLKLGNSLRTGSIDMPGGGAIVGTLTANTTVNFSLGSISKVSSTGPYTLSTTPTFYNHNLGVIPDFIILTRVGTNSQAETAGYNDTNMTTTQVELVSNGAFNFRVLAIKF